MTEDVEAIVLETVLEVPPSPTMSVGNGGVIFAGDAESIAMMTAKANTSDGLFRLLTQDLKFADFMREILLLAMKAVKSEAGSILEVDHSNNTLFFRAVVGTCSDRLGDFVIPIAQGIVGHVAESGQPMSISNVSEHRAYLKTIQDAIGFEARNLIAVPVFVRGRIFGVLELLNRVGEESFTCADKELLSYVCEMAGKAIEIRLMLAWALTRRNAA